MYRILPSRYRVNFCTGLTALSLALGIVSLTALDPVLAQEQRSRTLTVSGQGIVSIPTTISLVRLGVEVQGKTASEVQEEVARRSQSVVDLLKSRNVEKLETTGISLNPVYSYENNVQRLTGYSATNTVSFRIQTEKTGTLLDEAVKAGATRIDGISFVAADSAIASARQQALRDATQDAQSQADTVLAALNLKRRDIVSIQVNSASPPPEPIAAPNFARSAADVAAKTPVMGGEQQVQASVTLEIGY